mmetsp:Transcript_64336/g.178382  ORF Transcript_64336/g.178382 Transcript_64336/m.178382 type:complete len:323 (+) Transcript_64336:1417-2385(+)
MSVSCSKAGPLHLFWLDALALEDYLPARKLEGLLLRTCQGLGAVIGGVEDHEGMTRALQASQEFLLRLCGFVLLLQLEAAARPTKAKRSVHAMELPVATGTVRLRAWGTICLDSILLAHTRLPSCLVLLQLIKLRPNLRLHLRGYAAHVPTDRNADNPALEQPLQGLLQVFLHQLRAEGHGIRGEASCHQRKVVHGELLGHYALPHALVVNRQSQASGCAYHIKNEHSPEIGKFHGGHLLGLPLDVEVAGVKAPRVPRWVLDGTGPGVKGAGQARHHSRSDDAPEEDPELPVEEEHDPHTSNIFLAKVCGQAVGLVLVLLLV